MSKANKLASLAVDVNNLSDLADQVTDIENAIVRANTNAQVIEGIADDIEALEANTAVIMDDFASISNVFNSGITYSTDGENEYYDANSVTNTVATVDIIEMNIQSPQDGELLSYSTSANTWVNSPAPVIPETPAPVLSFRNKIINGDMRINQRNASGALVTSGDFIVDRFRGYVLEGSLSTFAGDSSISDIETTGCAKSLAIILTNSADGYSLIGQRIENSLKELSGKTVTISFWYYTNEEREFSIELLQYFGPTGSPLVRGIGATPITATTGAWTRVTQTVSIPSISSKTIGTDGLHMEMAIWFSDATNLVNSGYLGQQPSGTFFITGVQLEEGEVATPFEHRPYGLELSLCQRYFQQGDLRFSTYRAYYGNWVESWPVQFRTEMRVSPSMTRIINSSTRIYTDSDSTGPRSISATGFNYETRVIETGALSLHSTWSADAEL